MAALNEILGQAARHSQGLARKFGIIGGAPSPQLTPEVSPTYPIPFGPEDYYPQRDRLFSTGGYLSADAVLARLWKLVNPAGSGVLAVVESMRWQASGATLISVQMGNQTANGTIQGTHFARDGRIIGPTGFVSSSCIESFTTTAAGTTGGDVFNMPTTSVIVRPEGPWVLSPGSQLVVFTDTANVALIFGCAWRERPATQLELTS